MMGMVYAGWLIAWGLLHKAKSHKTKEKVYWYLYVVSAFLALNIAASFFQLSNEDPLVFFFIFLTLIVICFVYARIHKILEK